jgi:hypothetical protein
MHGANIAIGTFGRFACQLPGHRFSGARINVAWFVVSPPKE